MYMCVISLLNAFCLHIEPWKVGTGTQSHRVPMLDSGRHRKVRVPFRELLTVLVAPVPCPIHCPIRKDPQEVAPVAAVEKFGFLVVPCRQIKPLGQGCEGGDLSFGHGSAATGGGTLRAERNEAHL